MRRGTLTRVSTLPTVGTVLVAATSWGGANALQSPPHEFEHLRGQGPVRIGQGFE